jgi:hypothetical protein
MLSARRFAKRLLPYRFADVSGVMCHPLEKRGDTTLTRMCHDTAMEPI